MEKGGNKAAAWALGLLIAGLAVYVLWSMWGAGEFSRPATDSAPAPTHSALLGADLPATHAAPLTPDAEQAAERVATLYGVTCTTNRETYLMDDDLAALDGLNKAVQSGGWQRADVVNSASGSAFKLHKDKDLFVVEAAPGLTICEY
ncbi:MAG: hypothetical protein Q4C89_00870 [Deinococcus sp.]|uniref:hypothetical protein n=1 Tax=Deinococcus sp. TaxID=47478 RepID=UPI0026DB397D|nr:hypothetical protein [Deinococcus sp.]MDO4244561.1 hypothetical protein [Deinococcus sp.]